MIPEKPISPLFKSSFLSLDWCSDSDDVFLESNTNPFISRTEATLRVFTDFHPTTAQQFIHNTESETRNSLQVVPQMNTPLFETCSDVKPRTEFTFHVISPKDKHGELLDCMFSATTKDLPQIGTLTPPGGPTRKLSDSEIELLKLLSPSMFVKSPRFSFENPDRRTSSEDLSVYLPDNFTPAPVEILESSLEETVFRFPGVLLKEEESSEKEESIQTVENTIEQLPDEMEEEEGTMVEDLENSPVWRKRKISKAQSNVLRSSKPRKRRKVSPTRNEKVCKHKINIDDSESRNKMERDRRTELNYKFDNLRDSIPDVKGKVKASKICILGRAASFCDELQREDELLQQQKINLKKQNNELWNKLLKISSR